MSKEREALLSIKILDPVSQSGTVTLAEHCAGLGFALVPKEPTEAMKAAGRAALRENGLLPAYTDGGGPGQPPMMQHMMGAAYKAMIDEASK